MSLAKIEGHEIVVRIPIDALPACFTIAMDNEYGMENYTCAIDDLPVFATYFVAALNDEAEDGETVLHVAFDSAIIKAVNYGCEGVTP